METKKTKIMGMVALAALALTVIVATYAFFAANVGDPAAVDITVNAHTVDTFTFSVGDPISITLDRDNFARGKGNQTANTTATATLTANNKTNSATEHYYVYLSISKNSYGYSINESSPEIIMTLTNSSGEEITDISGLTHVTAKGADGNEVSGYDLTGVSGLISLVKNKEISTTSSIEETWNITITLMNYDADQTANAGGKLEAQVLIRKDLILQSVSDVCSSGDNLATCITTLSNKGETKYTNIYYHDANLANGANDKSYRYAGGDTAYYTCTYNGEELPISFDTDDEMYSECQKVFQAKTVKGETIYFTSRYFGDTHEMSGDLSEAKMYDMSWDETENKCYDADSEYEFIDYNGEPLTKEMCNGKSYFEYGGISVAGKGNLNRVSQAGVKNYVCFGSDADTCPTDNLYRIIGVFNGQVKLIKSDYATTAQLGGSGVGDYANSSTLDSWYLERYKGIHSSIDEYYWNYKATGSATNTWSTSLLNKTNLNTNFINYLGTTWAGKIADTTWKVGGNTRDNISRLAVPATTYANEITNPASTNTTDGLTTYGPAKIGLMYVSDYGFAASPSAWTTTMYSYYLYDIKSVNWMYLGFDEWTISRRADYSGIAFVVYSSGGVGDYHVSGYIAVRPVFYLESSATYSRGDGTSGNPYRLG